MGEDAIYIDENGQRVDPSSIGTTHDIVGQQTQKTSTPTQAPNLYNKLAQEEKISNFISQTSPTQSLRELNYILEGYMLDSQSKEYVKVANSVPDKIRLDFLQFITSDLSDNLRMSNLNPQQINGIMEFVIEWVIDYLDIVADDEKLGEEQLTKIALIMIKATFYTLLRSQNGMEKGQIFRSLTMGEQLNPQGSQMQPQKSFWQFWK